MSSNGIEGLIVETHNWGKSVAFWHDLGYDLEHSLVLRHPAGGPFIYLIERPESQNLEVLPIVAVEDSRPLPPVRSSVGSNRSTGECPRCCYLTPIADLSASKAHCPMASRRLKAMARSSAEYDAQDASIMIRAGYDAKASGHEGYTMLHD